MGYPLGCPKMELAAKMAQDASKSGFEEALEASWVHLGRPKREPSWSKIEACSFFCLSWKGTRIKSGLGLRFCSFWEPLGEAKTYISHWRDCKNQLFIRPRPLWPHGKIAFWYQKCNISIGFLRFCKFWKSGMYSGSDWKNQYKNQYTLKPQGNRNKSYAIKHGQTNHYSGGTYM